MPGGPSTSVALPVVDVDLAAVCGTTIPADNVGGLPAGGGVGQDTSAIACPNGVPDRLEASPGAVPIRICTVALFDVNTLLVSNLSALLAAAATDGISLGGGAFRSHASQISLRRAHCGPSTYDIWQRPSRECRPPTAIPGQSLHEWGLAVDTPRAAPGCPARRPATPGCKPTPPPTG